MRIGGHIRTFLASVAGMCVLATASLAFAADAPRFVRLSIMLEPDWTATVSWETNGEVPGEIQYGLTPAYGTTEAAFPAMPGPTGFSHLAVAQGLDPATTYHYRVGNATDGYSADYTFTTAPDTQCAPFSFVALGESRASVSGASADWANVLSQAAGENPGFILHAGDHVANGAFLAQWKDFFDKSAAVIPFVPIMSAVGATDVAIDIGDDALYNQFFAFPRNDYTDTEDFYSFDYGSVHVAVLSTETFNEQNYADQAMWLDDDLSWTDRIWKVVLLNRPPYSSGAFGSDDGKIIPYLTDVFEKYGVDLVIGAHDRDYERFKPLKGGQEVASYDGATLHVVTGGAGAPVDPLFPSRPKLPESAVTDNKNHYVVFSVNGTSMHLKAVRVPGGFQGGTGVIDELDVQKTVSPDPCFVEPDAGTPDAGQDAGQDGGSSDSGVDASTSDSGLDAGAPDAGEADVGPADAEGVDAAQTDTAQIEDTRGVDVDSLDANADVGFVDVAEAGADEVGTETEMADQDATLIEVSGDAGRETGDGASRSLAPVDETDDAGGGGCSCACIAVQ
ncbi:MAG: metallophosphoesterase family protein [Deltaproteobacteria bacterium]|nr:metallophosphoesterase family protein [Deltaproteobacteria bacterium]